MTVIETWWRPAARSSHRAAREWAALDARTQNVVKVAVIVVATGAAYRYSLSTLLGTLSSDTPLAYLALVPIIAAALAWVHRMPRRVEPAIHDRQLDYTIGLPLIAVALLAAVVLPRQLGAMAWVNRLDLLFLPMFVAGATVLLFGVRVAWRQRSALAYLFLMWPWPYASVLLGAFDGFRTTTLGALDTLTHVVPVATRVGSIADGRFVVVHHGHPFTIAIVTACSGVNGMVGFLLVGVALAACSRGSIMRKTLWIGLGLVWLWLVNVLRLVFIFWLGAWQGEHLALGVVHPYVGLVTFAASVVAIVAVMPRFGLELAGGPSRAVRRSVARNRSGGRPGGRRGVPLWPPASVLLVASVVVASGNAALARFDPVASAAGEPRLSSYLVNPATPAGWTVAFQQEVTRDRLLFGATSRWFRYLYVPTSTTAGDLHSTEPVTADVVDEDGLGGFQTYGVPECYSFHGYTLRGVSSVDLGSGVTGQSLSYATPAGRDWSIVYWLWPVRTGDGTRYERVILYLQNTTAGRVTPPGGEGAVAAAASGAHDGADVRLAVNRAFLVAFAREIVVAQRAHRDFDARVTVFPAPDASRTAFLLANGTDARRQGGRLESPHDAFWRRYREHQRAVARQAAAAKAHPR